MKDTISCRQAGIIGAILIFANKVLALPSLLAQNTGADAIFIMAFMFLIDIMVLFVFFRLKRAFPHSSFFDVIKRLSKPICILILGLFFIYFFIGFLINFNFTHVYFKVQVYHDDQESVFLFVAIVIMIATMSHGFRAIARTIEFFYLFILIGFFACMFIALSNFNEFAVMFDTPILQLVKNGYKYSFAFGDMLYLFLIMDKVELTKNGQKQILKYILFAMLVVLGGYFLFYCVYQYTLFIHPNAVSDIIVLSYQIFNVGRLEIVAVVLIMLITLFQISLYGYILGHILMQIFPKLDGNFSIVCVVILFLIVYTLFFNSLDSIVNAFTGNFVIFAILLQYLIPLICFGLSFFKRRRGP